MNLLFLVTRELLILELDLDTSRLRLPIFSSHLSRLEFKDSQLKKNLQYMENLAKFIFVY